MDLLSQNQKNLSIVLEESVGSLQPRASYNIIIFLCKACLYNLSGFMYSLIKSNISTGSSYPLYAIVFNPNGFCFKYTHLIF